MHRNVSILLFTALHFVTCPPARLYANEPSVSIEANENWSALFADDEHTLTFAVRAAQPMDVRALWSFSAKGRVIARGERALRLGAAAPEQLSLRLAVPPVSEQVVFPAQLTIRIQGNDRSELLAEFHKPLWLFPRDPFNGRRESLKALPLHLYDPPGSTAKVLQAAEVPFEQIHRLAALEEVDRGLLIVGEGIAWNEHRQLAETLVRMASTGVTVLCLAPAEGHLRLPHSGEKPFPQSLMLSGAGVISELDKRLDAGAWPPAGGFGGVAIEVEEEHGEAVARFSAESAGWRWLEVVYPEQGSLVVCGLGIVERWNQGPTPRYLLARILEKSIEDRHKAIFSEENE